MLAPFKKKKSLSKEEKKIADILKRKLCALGPAGDFLTIREAMEGIGILGSSGSGKTTSIAALLKDGLHALKEMGGVHICIKSDESSNTIPRIIKAGREDDMVHFHADSHLEFNFIEAARIDGGKLDVSLLANTLLEAYRQMRSFKSINGNTDSSDPFWDDMREIRISILILTLDLAGEQVSIQNLSRLSSHDFGPEDVGRYDQLRYEMGNEKLPDKQREVVWSKFSSWLKENYLLYCLELAKENVSEEDSERADALHQVLQYWMQEWPDFAPETRSSIKGSLMALLSPFTSPGILKSHFSTGLSSELDFSKTFSEGKIIVIDFPPTVHEVSGAIATGILKYAFQQAIKRRRIQEEEDPRPCFLFVDEIQECLSPKQDVSFQGIARSNLLVTVFISQSIHSIAFALGTQDAEARAKSLWNNLGLKVFCANSDNTNYYASNLIGKSLQQIANTRVEKNKEVVHNYNQQLMPQVASDHFTRLRTGGIQNNLEVDCILFKAGKQWKSGKNYLEATYKQRF